MTKTLHSADGCIILGVDPGTRISGYGILSVQNQMYRPLDYGCIRPPPALKLSERYLVIFDSIQELIEKYEPTVLVVETQYVYKNVQSALKLGMARGAVMIAAKKRGLAIFYTLPQLQSEQLWAMVRPVNYKYKGWCNICFSFHHCRSQKMLRMHWHWLYAMHTLHNF
jgi:crossover junction endodeoxyribonuclease RuvC